MPEFDPAINPVCVRCGSDALIPDAFLYVKDIGTARLQIGVNRKPDAMVMKGPVRVDATARVCGECGAVELIADDPQALWEAHLDRLSRS